jgi:hypothetical protein
VSFIINPHRFGGGAFSPSDITGLQLWLKADAITGLSNNDPVTTWGDESGNNRDATQSTSGAKPLYKTGIQNSLPGVLFDGTDDYMLANWTHTGSNLSVFFVGQRVAAPADHENWITCRDSIQANDFTNVESVIIAYEGGTGGVLQDFRDGTKSSHTHPGNSVTFLYAVVYDGSNNNSYLDGVASVNNPVASTGSFGFEEVYLMARYESFSPSRFSNGYLFEVVAYDTALGTSDRQDVENYLTTKWNV